MRLNAAVETRTYIPGEEEPSYGIRPDVMQAKEAENQLQGEIPCGTITNSYSENTIESDDSYTIEVDSGLGVGNKYEISESGKYAMILRTGEVYGGTLPTRKVKLKYEVSPGNSQ